MRLTCVLLAGLLVTSGGCSRIATSEEEIPLIRQVVETTNEEMSACFADADAGCLSGFFSQDGWQMRSNAPVQVGQQAIQRYWQQNLPGGTWEFLPETQTVEESGPMAIERGKYTLTFTADPASQSMRTSFTEKGYYLTHWRLDTTGRWFIVAQALTAEVTGRAAQGSSESR
jgi:ketosteroid isomerase-like protein